MNHNFEQAVISGLIKLARTDRNRGGACPLSGAYEAGRGQ